MPYLDALGITECYVSPIWKPRPGSRHGYDVCDPNQLNGELGTREDFDGFVAALRRHDIGLILDIVPNHMAADEQANLWWRDVLRNGRQSAAARLFDINWKPLKRELEGKVLLPVLGTAYGEALESGQLRASVEDGEPVVLYGDRCFPLRLAPDVDIESVGALNGTPGDPTSFDRLHDVLEAQAYRLASWRTAAWELNYRRFFNIDHLIGVRVEDADVFQATHGLLRTLIADGVVTGLRIDHPDGLAVPDQYFRRLQALASEARGLDADASAMYIVIEKILVPGEQLDPAWPVHGTTGYEFLNVVNGVFIARERTRALARVYTRFAGRSLAFAETAYAAKKQVMEASFPADLDRLAHAINALSERDRASRDITLHALRRALIEVVACLGVYRTYATADGCSARDRERITAAAAEADARTPSIDPSAFAFVRDVLTEASAADPERLRVALRIQQFTGAVFAKAVEDTAFYRDNTLVSLNEVGGDPARQGVSVESLHRLNALRQKRTPLAMSTTGTHDTKLGEDARARLNVLTERPRDWQLRIGEWARANRSRRTRTASGWAPDRHDEYRFYQALVALWPPDRTDASGDEALADRLARYAIKAAREANRHTSWIRENAAYEAALERFVRESLTGDGAAPFLESVAAFAAEVSIAGAINSLAQTLVKIASPGVPDFYQGTELWDLHLVDPDNRDIVDLASRQATLAAIDEGTGGGREARGAQVLDLLGRWPDGAIKLFVMAEALRFRRRHRAVFLEGAYHPLRVDAAGAPAEALAFAREHGRQWAIVVVPRLAGRLVAEGRLPTGTAWGTASVELPAPLAGAMCRDVFTGADAQVNPDGRLLLADVFAALPVALLDVAVGHA